MHTLPESDYWLTNAKMHYVNNEIYETEFPEILQEDWGKVILVKREWYTEVIYNE